MQSEVHYSSLFTNFWDTLKSVPYLRDLEKLCTSESAATDSGSNFNILSRLKFIKSERVSENASNFVLNKDEEISNDDIEDFSDEDNLSDIEFEAKTEDEDELSIVFEESSECNKDDSSNELSEEQLNEQTSRDCKKVTFNLKPEMHIMIQWDFAYRAARKGPWEVHARDRWRFQSRIQNTERVLKNILSDQHRSHIWQQRFENENNV